MSYSKIEIILQEHNLIAPEQLVQLSKTELVNKTPIEAAEYLMENNYLTKSEMLLFLGAYFALDVIDVLTYPVDLQAVARIPKSIAKKYSILAIGVEGNHLILAVYDPMNLYALEDVRLVTNMQLQLRLAAKDDISNAIELHYSEVLARSAADSIKSAPSFDGFLFPPPLADDQEEQAPTVRLLNSLLVKGYNTNVSDIHIEPNQDETVIRMRCDGMLLPYMTLALSVHQGLIARTKILAQLDIAEKRRPQDGHFRITLNKSELNLRVSFIPTVYGEKCVIRFLTTSGTIDLLSSFGMAAKNYHKMRQLLKHSYGLIYFSGPTGSGKTTTLYEILKYLSNQPVNIMTIEDPVERNLPRINQMQINEPAGITFQTGMRALLRQDPDIIMIGETRDSETAAISARAAMTGHLVLSTLHTNDAVSAVVRLKDLGLPDYLIESSMIGVVAQRLVRKICPHCKIEYEAGEKECRILDMPVQRFVLSKGNGCHLCRQTGYLGRRAVHEILLMDYHCRRLVSAGDAVDEIRGYARQHLDMSLIRDEIKALVLAQITTVEEMERITYQL